jgi:hypothetical protein
MKCSICNEKIEETFLGKMMGTYIGKKPVCKNCQKTLKTDTNSK